MIAKRIVIFSIFFFKMTLYADTDKSIKYYTKGMKYYIDRNYKAAADEWIKALEYNPGNKKIKRVFNLAMNKYYTAKKYFYNGMTYFEKQDYINAIKFLKKALLINPLDKKSKYYLGLCYTPHIFVSIDSNNNFVSTKQKIFFNIEVDYAQTPKNWLKKWEFYIATEQKKILVKKSGKHKPGNILKVKIKNGYEGKAYYFMKLVSISGRVISSITNMFIVDNTGPEINIKKINNDFIPGSSDPTKNKVKFHIKIKDKFSGLKNFEFIIYSKDKKRILWREIRKEANTVIVWDGRINDSNNKIIGGTVLYYKVIAIDNCNNRSESALYRLDTDILLKKKKEGLVMSLPNIEFEIGNDKITKDSYPVLQKVGEILKKYKNFNFIIAGHTDDIGDAKKNLILSRKRAISVFKYLNKKYGIKKEKITIVGYGETRPLVPNTSNINRKKNRRVEIIIRGK